MSEVRLGLTLPSFREEVEPLLEVAAALEHLPNRPKRSILVAFWDGEEKGLLGSDWYVEHPIFSHASVMA